MAKPEKFYFLSELAKRWDLDINKLVHLASQSQLEVRVIAPEQYDEDIDDKEYARRTIDGTYEYRPVDAMILQELVGRGKDRIKAGSVIQWTPEMLIYTFRETEFCDLAVFENEAQRFELDYFDKPALRENKECNRSNAIIELKIDEQGSLIVFNGQEMQMSKPQIGCIKVLKKRYEQCLAGNVKSADMPQSEILSEAGLPHTSRPRLDDVFKSRKKEFQVLIKKSGRGRYELNLPPG